MPLLQKRIWKVDEIDKLYLRQSEWTRPFRKYFFTGRFPEKFRVLDAGGGTGVIGDEIGRLFSADVYSIDVDFEALFYSLSNRQNITFHAQANIYLLPFSSNFFHCSVTHFVFLWLAQPEKALRELIRVTMPSGWVVAIAEPDYESRIDYPSETSKIGQLQKESLIDRGINPIIGRQLFGLFNQCGLKNVVAGVYNNEWNTSIGSNLFEKEWEILSKDLSDRLSSEEIQSYRQIDFQHFKAGKRISFVPTFYAFGQVPE